MKGSALIIIYLYSSKVFIADIKTFEALSFFSNNLSFWQLIQLRPDGCSIILVCV
jgi:hypothetical protein